MRVTYCYNCTEFEVGKFDRCPSCGWSCVKTFDLPDDQFGIYVSAGFVLINTTPHDVNVFPDGDVNLPDPEPAIVIPSAPKPLRANEEVDDSVTRGGIDFVVKRLDVSPYRRLPYYDAPILYIVPLAVAQIVKRNDFIVPDQLIRDDQGRNPL